MKTTQNKSTFTPGPWYVNQSAAEKNIARVTCDTGVIAECGGKEPQHYANARLIAAAPEMFAALEWAARGTHHPTCKIAKGKGIYCNCHVAACQAAIQQAKKSQ